MTGIVGEHMEAAADSCRAAVQSQRTTPVDHADIYAVAGSVVDVLRALDGLSGVLEQQVGRYDVGRHLYDDEGENPAERLAVAVAELGEARAAIGSADAAFNAFWSSMGHIGVEVEQ